MKRRQAARWLLTFLAWLASVAVLAPICFFAVIFLAGPHSSLLPSAIQSVVLIVGWVAFLAVPILVARAVHRRLWR
ncbi:MAG TPA: hypothetical protein VJM31_00935 [Vicinamibacterales bacterium]|nr:hypothetical protein [Vicinamibacterales bacterium]